MTHQMLKRPRKKEYLDKTVLELSRERIAACFDRYDHISVQFSGGKDSTVTLQLVLEEAERRGTDVDVVFWDEEAIAPDTVDYVRRVTKLPRVNFRWMCLPVKHRNACSNRSEFWYPWAPEDEAKWCRPLPPEAITQLKNFNRDSIPDANKLLYAHLTGSIGLFLGIRCQESLRRFEIMTRRQADNYIGPALGAKNVYLVKPIYDWLTEDIWTAPKLFGWDYNRAYDVMEMHGISRHGQRVCPPYGEEPLRNLAMYAECWPELWDKMLARVPGAATAARYSKSPLYAFQGVQGPKAGETWQEVIEQQMTKWPAKTATIIASRLQRLIAQHNRLTDNTPLEAKPHPASGVGWEFILTIASRGDLKTRRFRKYDQKYFKEKERGQEDSRGREGADDGRSELGRY